MDISQCQLSLSFPRVLLYASNSVIPPFMNFLSEQNVILKYSNTLRRAYSSIPVTVAGKTGTAQQGANIPPHSVFVSYAPSSNPEVSVIAVIANGYSGNYSGLLCRDIYGYYYNGEFREFLLKSNKEGEIQ